MSLGKYSNFFTAFVVNVPCEQKALISIPDLSWKIKLLLIKT